MRRRRLAIGAAAAVSAAAVLLLSGALRETAPAPAGAIVPASTPASRLAFAGRPPAGEPSQDHLVRAGLAFHQRMRETADPAYLTRAERAFRQALRRSPANAGAYAGLARIALTRHEFARSLGYARRARALASDPVEYLGIVGDALVELGRHDDGFAAYDRVALREPGPAAYARVAQARRLLGDAAGAMEALRLTVQAYGHAGEPAAWARVQLGNVHLDAGRLDEAEALYREALAVRPGDAPALAGLADAAATRGENGRAVALYRRALAAAARPEYAAALGDALLAQGRREEAERAYARALRLEARLAAHGVRTELDRALFLLDRDRELTRALDLARVGYRLQPGVEGSHILAWALYKNRRCEEARSYSERALRLAPTDQDALYHRALIERCLGNAPQSAAFVRRLRALNPLYFRSAASAAQLPVEG